MSTRNKKAYLVLEDGSVYEGLSFGGGDNACGEVVFNTGMIGYQETLTDPLNAGQIVVCTYPIIGNYGINEVDMQSDGIKVAGLVVRGRCDMPSHSQSVSTLHEFMKAGKVPAICGIDTRAVTRRLRSQGVMMGMITCDEPEKALKKMKKMPRYDDVDYVKQVGAKKSYKWKSDKKGKPSCHVAVVDCGVRYGVLRRLASLGCECTVVPSTTTAEDILKLKPQGILLSSGPGAPERPYLEETVRGLMGKKPLMGMGLGHQILARALGCDTYKLKFGHRGSNQPVRDMDIDRIRITVQNHGYVVDGDSVKDGVEVNQVNLNDGTVEGLRQREYGVLSVQYEAEADPGPLGAPTALEQFVTMIKG